mmetsp:Transcript_26285/g.66077  ORF Transcript_26285/g.66077 Transcript_26285/m.66077 type:complete len:190 (+) Transcript_26285:413-982(+)
MHQFGVRLATPSVVPADDAATAHSEELHGIATLRCLVRECSSATKQPELGGILDAATSPPVRSSRRAKQAVDEVGEKAAVACEVLSKECLEAMQRILDLGLGLDALREPLLLYRLLVTESAYHTVADASASAASPSPPSAIASSASSSAAASSPAPSPSSSRQRQGARRTARTTVAATCRAARSHRFAY